MKSIGHGHEKEQWSLPLFERGFWFIVLWPVALTEKYALNFFVRSEDLAGGTGLKACRHAEGQVGSHSRVPQAFRPVPLAHPRVWLRLGRAGSAVVKLGKRVSDRFLDEPGDRRLLRQLGDLAEAGHQP